MSTWHVSATATRSSPVPTTSCRRLPRRSERASLPNFGDSGFLGWLDLYDDGLGLGEEFAAVLAALATDTAVLEPAEGCA